MIRLAPWVHEVGGRSFTLRPLTVRERIAISETMADQAGRDVATDARAAGMAPAEALAAARKARDEARLASAVVMSCFTAAGALRVLDRACEDASDLMASVEPQEATSLALAALGIDLEEHERRVAAGNP